MTRKEQAYQPSSLYKRAAAPIITCPGCGHPLVWTMVAEALEELELDGRAVGVTGATCGGPIGMMLNVEWVYTAHGRPADVATAMKRVSDDGLVVLTYQGDGDTWAIGMEPTMHAAIRGERITIVMVNNGNYGTTGGQMAPTTLLGQKTTTSPFGRDVKREGFPIRAPELLSTLEGVAYAARGSVSSPANFQRTKKFIKTALLKQVSDIGFSYVEVLSPCPPDWHLSPGECMDRIERDVVPQFPIGEFKNVSEVG